MWTREDLLRNIWQVSQRLLFCDWQVCALLLNYDLVLILSESGKKNLFHFAINTVHTFQKILRNLVVQRIHLLPLCWECKLAVMALLQLSTPPSVAAWLCASISLSGFSSSLIIPSETHQKPPYCKVTHHVVLWPSICHCFQSTVDHWMDTVQGMRGQPKHGQ